MQPLGQSLVDRVLPCYFAASILHPLFSQDNHGGQAQDPVSVSVDNSVTCTSMAVAPPAVASAPPSRAAHPAPFEPGSTDAVMSGGGGRPSERPPKARGRL